MPSRFSHVHITKQGDRIVVYGPINSDRKEFESLAQALTYAQHRAKAFLRACEEQAYQRRERSAMEELWAQMS